MFLYHESDADSCCFCAPGLSAGCHHAHGGYHRAAQAGRPQPREPGGAGALDPREWARFLGSGIYSLGFRVLNQVPLHLTAGQRRKLLLVNNWLAGFVTYASTSEFRKLSNQVLLGPPSVLAPQDSLNPFPMVGLTGLEHVLAFAPPPSFSLREKHLLNSASQPPAVPIHSSLFSGAQPFPCNRRCSF